MGYFFAKKSSCIKKSASRVKESNNAFNNVIAH